MHRNDADRMANSVDTELTAPDLRLHCLLRPIVQKVRIVTANKRDKHTYLSTSAQSDQRLNCSLPG